MQRKWSYFFPLALASLVFGIWLAISSRAPQAPAPPAITALWQIGFPDTRGRLQALSQWRGQIMVLNFWASWCEPCREELPDFAELRSRYHPKGIEFVGIAIDKPDNVKRFLLQHPVDFPILVGEGAAHSLARQLGNRSGALPYTIVVDREDNIVLTHVGRLPRARLEAILNKIGS